MAKQIIARALLQPGKNFPIDCETIDGLQNNTAVVQVLGNIAGDKAILLGCMPESGGARRGAGYVFLRTMDYPEGEVIYWEGGSVSGGMYVSRESVAVSAQGYDFPQAYTERSLRPGVGSENYSWADFKQYKTTRELDQENDKRVADIAKLAPTPLGVVQMWAGALETIPAGYALCDGSSLQIADYPDLYAAIGMTHGGTTGNSFKLPDLRSQFVVGYNPDDTDYDGIAKSGGTKTVSLTSEQMPQHSHSVNDYYWIEKSVPKPISGTYTIAGAYSGNGSGSDSDNNVLPYITHDTDSAGLDSPHENRPPYYVLAYIMKTKN